MVRTIIRTRICCVRVWFMGRHIYSYNLGNFPRINSSYLVSNMITGSVNIMIITHHRHMNTAVIRRKFMASVHQ